MFLHPMPHGVPCDIQEPSCPRLVSPCSFQGLLDQRLFDPGQGRACLGQSELTAHLLCVFLDLTGRGLHFNLVSIPRHCTPFVYVHEFPEIYQASAIRESK